MGSSRVSSSIDGYMVESVTPHSRKSDIDDAATLVAVGVLAATVAAVSHEVIGHAGGCLARGGEVTLLTSIYFHCLGGGDLVDALGPIGGLVCGVAAFALLRPARGWPTAIRLFLLSLGATALFWFFAQLARDTMGAVDDWAFTRASPWRWPLAVVGVAGYWLVLRAVTREMRAIGGGARRFLIPYAAGALSAAVAGAFWEGHRLASATEGVLAVGIASLGYVYALRLALRGPAAAKAPAAPGVWPWIVVSAPAYAVFVLIVGRGLGRLA